MRSAIHRARYLIAQRGLVDALVEPHAGAVVGIVVAGLRHLGVGRLYVDRHVFAGIVRQRNDGVDAAIAGDHDPQRPQPLGVARIEQDAQLLALFHAAVAARARPMPW